MIIMCVSNQDTCPVAFIDDVNIPDTSLNSTFIFDSILNVRMCKIYYNFRKLFETSSSYLLRAINNFLSFIIKFNRKEMLFLIPYIK